MWSNGEEETGEPGENHPAWMGNHYPATCLAIQVLSIPLHPETVQQSKPDYVPISSFQLGGRGLGVIIMSGALVNVQI